MKTIVELINTNCDWLYVKIFENPLFFFDFWSFVHFWSGGILITIILAKGYRNKWSILFSLLLFYEIVEISMLYVSLNVFFPETIKDQFTDIFVGMSGGYLFDKWLNFYSTNKKQFSNFFQNPNTHIALFTAITIAFDWVGFYRYKYNVLIFNSPGLNYTAFSLWSAGIFSVLVIYNRLSVRYSKAYSIALLWIIYFTALCIFEFTLYHIFGFKESGEHAHKPLFFNIIHGTTSLHLFYMLCPFTSVAIFSMFKKLFNSAFYNVRKFNQSLDLTESYDTVVGNAISYQPMSAIRIDDEKDFPTNI
jgi:hypothetical protein